MPPGTKKSSASSNTTGRTRKTATGSVDTTATTPALQIAASTHLNDASPSTGASVSATSRKRDRVRGPTRGKGIRKLIAERRGERIEAYVTPEMRAFCGINANKVSSELGTQIRRLCPIQGFYFSWKKVDSVLKEAIIQAVRDKICVTENGVEYTELVEEVFHEKADLLYKDWKCRMGKYYDKTKENGEDAYQHPFEGTGMDGWKYMIDHVFNDSTREPRRIAGKRNRKDVPYGHTLGSRSFPAAMTIAADVAVKKAAAAADGADGANKKLDFCDLYRASHLLRDTDQWIDPICKEIYEKMVVMRDEAARSGTPLSDEELSRNCLGEAKTKNYIRGFGKGPKPSTYFSKFRSQLALQDLQKVQCELDLIREERQREREEEKTRREEEQKQREEQQRRREEEWEDEKRRWEEEQRRREEEREVEKRKWEEERRRREEERATFLKDIDLIKSYMVSQKQNGGQGSVGAD